MDVATWCEKKGQSDVECKPFIPALRQVLEVRDADTTANASEIYSRLQEDHGHFYGLYFEAVRTFGRDKSVSRRLVHLLNALCNLYPDGCPSLLGMMVAEYCMDIEPSHSNMMPNCGAEWDAHRDTFTAANTWAAYYYIEGSVSPLNVDMAEDAEFAFVNALETSMDTDIQVRASSLFLEATKVWLEVCGKQLYAVAKGQQEGQASQDGTKPSRPSIVDDGGEWLWQGGYKVTADRWEFRKQRYHALACLDAIEPQLREVAAEGARLMQKAEDQQGQPAISGSS